MNAAARVAVAVSGGRDSTALLHATLRAADALGVQVWALHVHHGLVAEADAWLLQLQQQSRRWGAGFEATRLQSKPAAGDSIEAWARRERYRALAQMAVRHDCPLVLLAHHRRDQAETFLLQALRGGGPAGLAAMPTVALRHGLQWARPWLDQPREAIEAYVKRHRLRFVEDPSNTDPRYARNRLRGRVWPALMAAFPEAETSLVDAARHAADAAALAEEVAIGDLPGITDDGTLVLSAWQALPPARRRNALRAWLQAALSGAVPVSLVQRLCDELPGRRSGRWPAPQAELRLHRGRLARHALPEAAAAPLPAATAAALRAAVAATGVDLSRTGLHPLPAWQGRFEVLATERGGVVPALLRQLLPVARAGGERFHLARGGLARSLKKQYQAADVPAWARQGPLLCPPDGSLLFAPGLGINARWQAPEGQAQLAVRWLPDAPGPRQAAS